MIKMPKKSEYTKFKQYSNKIKSLFRAYADFISF